MQRACPVLRAFIGSETMPAFCIYQRKNTFAKRFEKLKDLQNAAKESQNIKEIFRRCKISPLHILHSTWK